MNDKLEGKFSTFKVNVIEKENLYIVEAELPGFEKENVSIEYDNNYLTISANKDWAEEAKEGTFIRRECKCGEFRRSFFIEGVLASDINASFKNGILTVELNRIKKREEKKVISID
ncbi:MAG: Hsp20/alpha crystallin family protein [Acidaminobacteraceae bacterium]